MFANRDGHCEEDASEIKRMIVSMATESSLLHSHFYKYSHSNKMPKVNCTLAPHPSKENADLIARLDAMQQSLKDMDSKIGCVVKGNADALEVLDTLIGTSDNVLEIAPASAPSSAPSSAPTATSTDVNQEVYNRLFSLIQSQLRDPKFRSNDAALIAANDSKSSWNTKIHFNRFPNKKLTLALMAYLKPKLAADGLRPSKIRSSIYTNCGDSDTRMLDLSHIRTYSYWDSVVAIILRCSAERKLLSALDAGRSRSRRASQATTNFDCRELAYSICKADIDTLMGKDRKGLINKAPISEGELEDEIPGVLGNHVICTVRPSWRSNEYNQFLGYVDVAVLKCLNLNVRQMAKKTFGRDAD
ncbi:hypothetical protein PHYBLDRAFT_164992 [Phycomyces blakesleeanus NRRL 1555(-)]|uniref:Uncharacterized protein n=1 Tax=Phycomyces blakesleeanus (strain ATCC 8743b / DSM 1359 / FGSC 10004 / NBRC 33097 / NRRL 1555) TaxID=763407 RepID=A0A167PKC3_PHYB8|nr:hypothetical protein PHYBLDRAFT_164992 [Phycomyces blakesleeanus NRRL 1555(-)]OAD78118.1 hypothetical protein PHYBLDRAFT_164992 [Phycomyces blakesleeanus NRRL 1555(-)]|eukprot:XP_018296158.1 hypothetical protein PHYBLDRAFT_164992 [Phycomyces blakesleeanus NRRL 1555(-)]